MQLQPYLTFNGDCEEALNFYEAVLGGTIENLSRFGETPGQQTSKADQDRVMHATFTLEDGVSFMASDSTSQQIVNAGNNITLSLNMDSLEETENCFNGLAEGGRVNMPLQDTFWGARFGMLTDKFNINWMFNCPLAEENGTAATEEAPAATEEEAPATQEEAPAEGAVSTKGEETPTETL